MGKLQFSGHESFHCRQFWLKKGFDFVKTNNKFSAESAVVELGVGKNMVTSIRYWMKAFGLLDEKDQLSPFAKAIFEKPGTGWDPYLEYEGTLWLLHYYLVKNGYASAFSLIFNEVRRNKPEFSEKDFTKHISTLGTFSDATLSKDFSVFKNTYVVSMSGKAEIEDSYSGILTELNLVSTKKNGSKEILVVEGRRRPEVPALIILYGILSDPNHSSSISFESLFYNENSVGSIFALNREGLIEKIEEMIRIFPKEINFKNDAGIRELQFKKKLDPIKDVLAKYYAN